MKEKIIFPPNEVYTVYQHALQGKINAIDAFLREDKNWLYVPLVEWCETSLIHIAAQGGYLDLVSYLYLIDYQLINQVDKFNRSPLYLAAQADKYMMVELLLSYGANPEIKANYPEGKQKNLTPLSYAKTLNNKSSLEVLLKHKIKKTLENSDPNQVNSLIDHLKDEQLLDSEWKFYLIYKLVKKGYVLSLDYLLKVIADYSALSEKFSDNSDFLHVAAHYGKIEMLEYLLRKKPDWNLYLSNMYSPEKSKPSLVKVEDVQDQLLEDFKKLSPCAYNFDNLLEATLHNHLKIVEFLVKANVNINILVGQKNVYLIHIAANKGYVELVRYFLAWNPNFKDSGDIYGQTPIFYAIAKGHAEVVDCLIDAGADLTIKVKRPNHHTHGLTPLGLAKLQQNHYISSLIINDECDRDKLISLIEYVEEALYLMRLEPSLSKTLLAHPKIKQLILDNPKADQLIFNEEKNKLHLAEKTEFVVNTNIHYSDSSPLDLARAKGHKKCVELLQNTYLRQFNELFPNEGACHRANLEMAVKRGHSQIVYFLLEQGLVIDFPLICLAIQFRHLDLVQNFLLLDKDLFKHKQQNLSIIEIAAMAKQEKILEYLINEVHKNEYCIEDFIDREKLKEVRKKVYNDKIISQLILAISKNNRKQIPELVDNVEQFMELLNLDPSLTKLFLKNERLKGYYSKCHVEIKGDENSKTLYLYKPANSKRKSAYLQVNRNGNIVTADLYKPSQELGKTSRNLVREFSTETGKSIAVKSPCKTLEIRDSKWLDQKAKIEREVNLTRVANNSNGFFECFHFTEKGYNFRFLQPVCQGENADSYMFKIKEPEKLAKIVLLIVTELSYKHTVLNLVHGDIKENNILIGDEASVKFIDYGHSRNINEKRTRLSVKHDLYQTWYAPECRASPTYIVAPAQDVYSLAIMFERIFTLHPCKEEVFQSYPSIQEFIEKGLAISPDERPKLPLFCEKLQEEIEKGLRVFNNM